MARRRTRTKSRKKKTKADFLKEQKRKGRSPAQAEATWRMLKGSKEAMKDYYALNAPRVDFDDTSIDTWFERDRAFVGLQNDRTGKSIIEWWDEDVHEAIDDGFLDPSDYHKSAYDYAAWIGAITGPPSARRNARTYSRGIIVEAEHDRMGNVVVTPRSKRVRAQMRRHNKEWTGHASDDVFFQEWRGDEFAERYLSAAQQRDLQAGYPVSFKMDPVEFGYLVGHDFHEVINP